MFRKVLGTTPCLCCTCDHVYQDIYKCMRNIFQNYLMVFIDKGGRLKLYTPQIRLPATYMYTIVTVCFVFMFWCISYYLETLNIFITAFIYVYLYSSIHVYIKWIFEEYIHYDNQVYTIMSSTNKYHIKIA